MYREGLRERRRKEKDRVRDGVKRSVEGGAKYKEGLGEGEVRNVRGG